MFYSPRGLDIQMEEKTKQHQEESVLLHLHHNQEAEREKEVRWAYKTSKPAPSNVLPLTRLNLLMVSNLSNNNHQLGNKISSIYKPLGDIYTFEIPYSPSIPATELWGVALWDPEKKVPSPGAISLWGSLATQLSLNFSF